MPVAPCTGVCSADLSLQPVSIFAPSRDVATDPGFAPGTHDADVRSDVYFVGVTSFVTDPMCRECACDGAAMSL